MKIKFHETAIPYLVWWFPHNEYSVLGMRMRLCLFTFGTCKDQQWLSVEASDTKLPHLWGLLSKEVPLTAITTANGGWSNFQRVQGKMRGTYTKFIPQQKAEIGKQATDLAATVCCYQKTTTLSWYQEKPYSHQDKTSEIGWREGNKDFTNILEKREAIPFF